MTKALAILLLPSLASCSKNTQYFYYSQKHHDWKASLARAGQSPPPTFSTVNGVPFTCWCKPSYIQKDYAKRFPDWELVENGKSYTLTIISKTINDHD